MNIIEKEAETFFSFELYSGVDTLSGIKSIIISKLYDFNRDRDKLDFLKILHEKTIQAKKNILKTVIVPLINRETQDCLQLNKKLRV